MGPRTKPSCFSKRPFRKKNSQRKHVHGGEWSAPGLSDVVFFTRADFLAKICDGNNERKEGEGENVVVNQISMCECKSISLLKEEPN